MGFPAGASTITVTGTLPNPVGGSARKGRIVFTPSARLVDSTQKAIYSGGGPAALDDTGKFSILLLCTDDTDVQPTGWRWKVDEQPSGGTRKIYWIDLPSTLGQAVDLSELAEVDAPDGGGSGGSGGAPTGPAGGALTGTYPNPQLSSATIASFDAAGSASTAQAAAIAAAATDATTKANAAQAGATSAAATDATGKVAAHTAASDPHGDRAAAAAALAAHASASDPHGDRTWADSKFATQLDLSTLNGTVNNLSSTVTAIDGYLNDALTRIQAIEQGTAFLAGGHFTGDVEVIDAQLTVRTTVGDVGRLRPTPWLFNVTDPAYGAKGDAKVIADGAITSGTAVLTSPSNGFAGATPGMYVSVKGAGPTGVTTHIAQIATKESDGQVTLTVNAAVTVSGAIVIFGTDDTAAIQAAVDAAEAYLATHTYAQVYIPPRAFVVAGNRNTSKSGNGQIVFGVYAASSNKRILEFRGESDGTAAVRHWEQTTPQHSGSCLLSLGVYASTTAQTNDLNANGNPAVISGPNEGTTNGLAYGAVARFSNIMPVLKNLAILTTHSAYGLTYGAANLWGCANAHVENFAYGTAGIVPGSDYTSPGTFGTGLSVGLLLPAPGNNDHVIARNVSCGGGYTYALFLTEHAVVDRYMALYCWAGLCPVGNYAGSVGSVHAMDVISASIEACINELYIVGVGSAGVGPTIYANVSTESGTPNIAGNSAGAMNGALGVVRLTGLFTESGVTISSPTGIEIVNGQVPRAIKRKTGAFTASPIDRTLICDTSAVGFTGTLPAADFNPVEYAFKNVGANTLTVGTTSSQLIYTSSGTGATTASVATGQTLRVQALYNGTSWGWYAV